jgi:uncharacterized protein (DUF1330 family)
MAMAAYIIVQVEVHDPETFKKYADAVPATIKQYGGRYCVRGGKVESKEGDWNPKRMVVLEFPDMATAHKWYDSSEYQAIIGDRLKASDGKMVFVEGYEG